MAISLVMTPRVIPVTKFSCCSKKSMSAYIDKTELSYESESVVGTNRTLPIHRIEVAVQVKASAANRNAVKAK